MGRNNITSQYNSCRNNIISTVYLVFWFGVFLFVGYKSMHQYYELCGLTGIDRHQKSFQKTIYAKSLAHLMRPPKKQVIQFFHES